MQIRNFSTAAVGWIFLLLSTVAGAWEVNENYDNQSVGEGCGSFATKFDSTVTTEKSSSGPKSCKMIAHEGSTGWGGHITNPTLRKGDEVWVRFRIFMPDGFDYNVYNNTDSNKFIRLRVMDSSGKASYLDWKWNNDTGGGGAAYKEKIQNDEPCVNFGCSFQEFGSDSDRPIRGTWETYEMYVKFDNIPVDAGGQGRVRAWKNGVLIGDLTRRRTLNNPGDYVETTLIFSYWNSGSPKTQHLYFDDFVVTNERPVARDSQGNAYIGVGDFVALAAPMPPSSIE
jgi:hypothetical protein